MSHSQVLECDPSSNLFSEQIILGSDAAEDSRTTWTGKSFRDEGNPGDQCNAMVVHLGLILPYDLPYGDWSSIHGDLICRFVIVTPNSCEEHEKLALQ